MNIISILAICLVLFLVVVYFFKKKKTISTHHNIMSNEEIVDKLQGTNVSEYCLKLIREYKSV